MPKIKYQACIYARLSREDGDDKVESNSISNQKAMVRDFLNNYPDIEVVSEKVDDGYSGVNFERPAFQEMMQLIREGKVNCVVCKDLSRFGRNYIEAGNYIERLFPFMNVRFIAINDGYDSAEKQNQSSSLVIPFKNLINDAYCKDISVKIRSQLEIKRKKGEFLSAFANYGYRKDPQNHNHLIVDPYAADIVRMIFRLKIEGMSQNRIAKKLNEQGILCPMEYKLANGENIQTAFRINEKAKWSPVTVTRILTNEVYLGVLVQGKQSTPNYKVKKFFTKDEADWIRVENTHEAIVDYEDFVYVAKLLKKDVRTSPKEEAVYPFSGFLRCADCRQNMIRKTVPSGNKKYYYYVCSTNKTQKGCSSHSVSEKDLEKAVVSAIMRQIDLIIEIERILTYIDQLPFEQKNVFDFDAQIVRLQDEIERCQKFKMKLYESLSEHMINEQEYFQFKNSYTAKIKSAQEAIANLEKERQQTIEGNHMESEWIQIFKKYQNIKVIDRRTVVELINHIKIHEDKRIEIIFNYQDKVAQAKSYIQKLAESSVKTTDMKGGKQEWHVRVENLSRMPA